MFDFSKARKSSQKVGSSMAILDFLNGCTCFSLYKMLTLGSTKNLVFHKKLLCQQKKIFPIEINVAQQNYVSRKEICCGHKKNYVTPKRRLILTREDSCWLNMFSVAQKRNTCLQKMAPDAYEYMLCWLKKFCVAR